MDQLSQMLYTLKSPRLSSILLYSFLHAAEGADEKLEGQACEIWLYRLREYIAWPLKISASTRCS